MTVHRHNRNLALTVIILILITLLPWPVRIGAWISGVGWQLVVPVTQPLTRVSHALRPEATPFKDDDPVVAEFRDMIEKLRVRIAQLEDQNATLQIELNALRDVASLTPADLYRPLRVDRSGSAPGESDHLFQVNAGSRQGVEVGTVAVVPPMQLAGIVTTVTPLTATVLPTTAGSFNVIEVRIDTPGKPFSDDPKGTLQPDEHGNLVGLFDHALIEELHIEPGFAVRLDDAAIGSAHTGLLVGNIVRIESNDANPLHDRVIVKPVSDPARVGSLYLMIRRKAKPFRDTTPTNQPQSTTGG